MSDYIFYKAVTLILILCEVLYMSECTTEFTHDRKRVSDLVKAEHSCLQKFKVGENSIIRTQDSRKLGAKFLNESDVGNREDCLNMCCNTPYCNVAIFQEQSPFSCYLFDCGEQYDFRCRFTSHVSYTSAMLNVNRHQVDLGLWSSQHQHESELANLRSPSSDGGLHGAKEAPLDTHPPIISSPETTAAPPTTAPSPPSTTIPPTVTPKSERNCSRFQFECHSGECLAVYNACDGIPQCQDGSDEGPDLGCPQGPIGRPDSASTQSQPTKGESSSPLQGLPQYAWNAQTARGQSSGKERGRAFPQRGSPLMEYPNRNYPVNESPDYGRDDGLNYNGVAPKSGAGYYDYNQRGPQGLRYSGTQMDLTGDSIPMYQHEYPDYGFATARHQDHSLQQVPQQSPAAMSSLQQQSLTGVQRPSLLRGKSWQGQNARYPINAGEQGGIQGGQSLQMGPQANQVPRIQKPSFRDQGAYEGPKMALRGPQQRGNDPSSANFNMNSPYSADISQALPRGPVDANSGGKDPSSGDQYQSASIKKQLDELSQDGGKSKNPSTTNATQSLDANTTQGVGGVQSPPKSAPDKSVKPELPRASGQSNQTKNQNDPESKSGSDALHSSHFSLSRLEIDVKELQLKQEEQKSEASGAVLALSLGICVTALLVLLVGCRMKNAKRRMRRHRSGRSSLEHDSDYLVNGMYL